LRPIICAVLTLVLMTPSHANRCRPSEIEGGGDPDPSCRLSGELHFTRRWLVREVPRTLRQDWHARRHGRIGKESAPQGLPDRPRHGGPYEGLSRARCDDPRRLPSQSDQPQRLEDPKEAAYYEPLNGGVTGTCSSRRVSRSADLACSNYPGCSPSNATDGELRGSAHAPVQWPHGRQSLIARFPKDRKRPVHREGEVRGNEAPREQVAHPHADPV
jgi:hypothetical protein